ncbi:thioredoxin-disulfide reductase [bacterium D16-76]|nr:thioredoxin-disulfide reductase [bacterium D16-76]
MLYDVIVIGGGPAGYTCALYAARANLNVLVLEKLAPGGQMATTDRVDNYPGFPDGVEGFELAMSMKKGAERFGAVSQMADVTEVKLQGDIKEICAGGKQLQARTVVLASGARPRELGLPGEKELRGRGVSYCATCDGMFYRGKTVVVAGGGDTACADALYLSRLCQKVLVVHRRDKLRASAAYQKPLLEAGNVEFIWDSEVMALEYADILIGAHLRNKKTGAQTLIACSGLFVAIGQVPETGLFAGQIDLDPAGYVLAGEDTRTNLPGVFCAGDLRAKPLRQIVTACADGAVAAQAAEEYLSM